MSPESRDEFRRLKAAVVLEAHRLSFPVSVLERAETPADLLVAALRMDDMIFAARKLAVLLGEYERGRDLTERLAQAVAEFRRAAVREFTERRTG